MMEELQKDLALAQQAEKVDAMQDFKNKIPKHLEDTREGVTVELYWLDSQTGDSFKYDSKHLPKDPDIFKWLEPIYKIIAGV